MSDTEQQDTNHQQPVKRPRKSAATASTEAAAASEPAVTPANDATTDAASAPSDTLTDGPTPEGAPAVPRSTVESVSQAAGEAAERAGVAAQRAGAAAQRATGVLTDVATDVASTVSAHAPAVVDASRTTAGFAARGVRSASSESLVLGAVFSSGVAFGLQLARASRVLVVLALVPVVVSGVQLVGRRAVRGPSAAPAPAPAPAPKSRNRTNGTTNVN